MRCNLVAISPSPLSTPGFTIIESVRSEAIDAARLTYFGVSIFWRASVHDWVLMRRHPKRLELGPYEQPLRLFLLDLASFPSDARMIISVTSAMGRMRDMLMTFPFLKSRQPKAGRFPSLESCSSRNDTAGRRERRHLRREQAPHQPNPHREWATYQTCQNRRFAHWPVPLSVAQAALPKGLEIDLFDGQAYISTEGQTVKTNVQIKTVLSASGFELVRIPVQALSRDESY